MQIMDCLHMIPRGEALKLEAANTSGDPGFHCPTCNHKCIKKVSEMLPAPKASPGNAATRPSCGCKEDLVAVHCKECDRGFCDVCFDSE